ncbi:aldo/keto reductase [Klebsiella pneumoniae]|nr:aldo/keto reductase [Klebsiella pneumoniae]
MSVKTPDFKLSNGVMMPAIGLGVYQSGPDETIEAVKTAIKLGYRLIDTAAAYNNELQVGTGIKESDIARKDIFVTTKLKPDDFGFDSALAAFDASMDKLGLDVLDLYLLHWPMPARFNATLASWKAAARLLAEGRVRAIGVCNFLPAHLETLITETGVTPVLNQVELHPFLVQNALREANEKLNIVTQAWSPIGGANRYWKTGDDPLCNPVILQLSEEYRKSPAQIILRWHLDRNTSVIPKSVNPVRLAENINVFDFTLSKDDILKIDALDQNRRSGPDPEAVEPHRPAAIR